MEALFLVGRIGVRWEIFRDGSWRTDPECVAPLPGDQIANSEAHRGLPKIPDPVILVVHLSQLLISRSGAVRIAWAVAWLPGGGMYSSGHHEGEK
jgi:hypothetical protein